MRMIAKLVSLFFAVSALITAGCGGGGGSAVVYDPVWIAASWSGGKTGTPSDRTDVEPDYYLGQLCPASSVLLTNQSGFAGITIINNCTLPVTYYICASKGSLPQPDLGLAECATDPFDTPAAQLTIVPLNPGEPGFSINATEEISINILYCSSSQQLNILEAPLTCL